MTDKAQAEKVAINPIHELLTAIEIVHGSTYANIFRQFVWKWENDHKAKVIAESKNADLPAEIAELTKERDAWESGCATVTRIAQKAEDEIAALKSQLAVPPCEWCRQVGTGFVPCPLHGGGEKAYELTGNQEAIVERARAELLKSRLAEAINMLAFIGHEFCTSPLPLQCKICSRGNRGIGFDFCALRKWIDAAKELESGS